MDEFELIRRYFDRRTASDGVIVGVGDDGAVLEPTPGLQQVQVIDTLVEGAHFPAHFNPADLGYRAVAVNLSDVAAMGAAPRWMTLALSLARADEAWLDAFAEGLYTAAHEFGVALVGGDTTTSRDVVVTVQITAEIEPGKALLRSGAQAGDRIYVTGTVGDAAAGLDGLLHGRAVKELAARFSRPSARIAYGQSLVGRATAAIDLSDGLYGDLKKLLFASGVGAEIDIGRLPLSDALVEHFPTERCRSFALAGGDDYELLFTSPASPPDPGIMRVTDIGTVTAAKELVCRLDGHVVPYDDSGFRHFQ